MIMAEELVVGTMVPFPEGSTRPMALITIKINRVEFLVDSWRARARDESGRWWWLFPATGLTKILDASLGRPVGRCRTRHDRYQHE
jgi:hypothetical protein